MCFRKRCRRSRSESGGAPPRSSSASSRPAAHVPPSRMHASGRSRTPRSARTRGASSSISATVSARHSTTSSLPTSHVLLASAGVAQRDHAGVEQQPAVAVLRQRGELVAAGHRDTRPLERLEQRVREPLRKLVERHPALRRALAAGVRMPPRVAERHAVDRAAGEPDRAEQIEQRAQDRRRGDTVARPCGQRDRRARRGVRRRAPRPVGAAAPRGLRGPRADCRRAPGRSPQALPRRCARAPRRRRAADRAPRRTSPASNARKLATPRPSERVRRCPVRSST